MRRSSMTRRTSKPLSRDRLRARSARRAAGRRTARSQGQQLAVHRVAVQEAVAKRLRHLARGDVEHPAPAAFEHGAGLRVAGGGQRARRMQPQFGRRQPGVAAALVGERKRGQRFVARARRIAFGASVAVAPGCASRSARRSRRRAG